MHVKMLIMNGPNMNFLGLRSPQIYGTQNYDALVRYLHQKGKEMGIATSFYQSNSEGDLIDRIQMAYAEGMQGVVFNPGAYTHYSYAIRDAIESVPVPFIEVHMSDIYGREPFRAISVTKEVCIGQVSGMGFDSYVEGMRRMLEYLQKNS